MRRLRGSVLVAGATALVLRRDADHDQRGAVAGAMFGELLEVA